MSWQFPLFTIPILFGGVISVWLSILSFQHGEISGARSLGYLTGGAAWWTLAYFLELCSANFEMATFWLRVEYFGLVVIPIAWLALALEYRAQKHYLTARNLILLSILPVITVSLAITNSAHGLIWKEIGATDFGGYFLLSLEHGIWFWINAGYTYLCILLGIFLLVGGLFRTSAIYKSQIISIILGLIAPLIANICYLAGWNPIAPLDLTVFSFVISGVAFSLAIFHFRLLDILPVARERVIENLGDGVLVVNGNGILIDMNPSAREFLNFDGEIATTSILDLIPQWKMNLTSEGEILESTIDLQIPHHEGKKWVTIETLKLENRPGLKDAQVVVVRDISKQKGLELDMLDQQQFLMKLNEIMGVAISSAEFIPMLNDLAGKMADLFQADGCFITGWDDEKKMTIPLARSTDPEGDYQKIVPRDGMLTMTESVIREGRPLAVQDIANTPYMDPEISKFFTTKSMLAIPLIQNDKGFGSVLIGFDEKYEFSNVEILRAEMVSRQVALAFARIMSLEEADRRTGELESLQKATAIVAASTGREATIDGILDQLENLVGYDSAYVMLLKDGKLEFVGGHGTRYVSEWLGTTLPGEEEGPEWQVMAARAPMVLADPNQAWPDLALPFQEWVIEWLGVPLVVGDEVLGLLSLESAKAHFDMNKIQLVQSFANNVAIALRDAQLMEELKLLATIDELTGINNRRRLFELGTYEIEVSRRYGRPLAVIMLDIDNFKQINDNFGHVAGDQVLQELTKGCLSRMRKVDIMGRYGGEEFVILLPEANLGMATETAERIRQCTEKNTFWVGEAEIQLTVSLGVAEYHPDIPDMASFIDRADTAMYQAKAKGRNQVAQYLGQEK